MVRGLLLSGILLLGLALASPSAHGATMTPEDTAKYRADIEDGIRLLRADNIPGAIGRFKNALKLDSESAEAYYWIALAYSDQTNLARALSNIRDAIAYNENMPEAWLLWGQVLLYQKNWNEALEKLERAARLAPDDPVVLYNLGRVHYHGFNNPDAALSKFIAVWQKGQALRRERPELAPLVIRSRLYMGYCEFDRERWSNAINAFLDVLAEQPNNTEAALRLALAYRHTNRAAECRQILQNILRATSPDTPAGRQLLAEVNLQLADLYLKDPALKDRMFALAHLREFVAQLGDANHPSLEPAKEYLAQYESMDG